MSSDAKGWGLGLLGVVIFALSIPMTRLAGGPAADPQLPPEFVAVGRAALAGLLSVAYLMWTRAPRPAHAHWRPLAWTALGVVFGWPLFLGWAVREVESIHASVVSGVLPLATAALGALMLRQRPSPAFWGCALLGCGLVVAYAWLRGPQGSGFHLADGLLLLAVLSAAFGYVCGARLSIDLKPAQVICWVLVISLPITLPATLLTWPAQPVRFSAWTGFVYVALFSMWLGFFAWYRGLAIGGTVRVSQVQLVQPFLSMLFSVPILGERLESLTLWFALAVMATVFLGKRMPIGVRPAGGLPARTTSPSSV